MPAPHGLGPRPGPPFGVHQPAPWTVWTNTAEGGSVGTAESPGNSGGASGRAWDSVTIGANCTVQFDATTIMHGALVHEFITGSTSNAAFVQWNWPYGEAFLRFYLYFTGPAASTMNIVRFMAADGATQIGRVSIPVSGKLQLTDQTASQVGITANALPINQWVRVEVHARTATATTGLLELKYWSTVPDGVSSPDETITASGIDLTTNSIGQLRFGLCVSNPNQGPLWIDDFAASPDGYIGPSQTSGPVGLGPLYSAAQGDGGWYTGSFEEDQPEQDGFWAAEDAGSSVTMDVPALVLPPIAIEPLEAAQGETFFEQPLDSVDDGWYHNVYGFPEYQTDPSLDVTPQFFPPAAAGPTDAEAQAASQLGEFDVLGHYTSEETQDYQNESTLEIPAAFVPIPPTDAEIAAETQLSETPTEVFIGEETTDYQAESTLEIPADPGIINPPPTDAEAQAEAPLAEHDFWTLSGGDDYWDFYSSDSALDVAPLTVSPSFGTFTNTAEGGTDGVGVTTGNSGGASGQAWDAVGTGGGTVAFNASLGPPIDTMGYRFNQTTTGAVRASWAVNTIGVQQALYARTYVLLNALPGSSSDRVIVFSASAALSTIGISTTGKVNVTDGNTIVATSATTLNVGQWYRIEAFYQGDPSGPASITARIFIDPNGSTPDETVSANIAGGLLTSFFVGQSNGTAGVTCDTELDNISASTVTWPGPLGVAPDFLYSLNDTIGDPPALEDCPDFDWYDQSLTSVLEVPSLYPVPPTDAETAAETQLPETPMEVFVADETTDYQFESTLDLGSQVPVPPTDVEAQAEAQLIETPMESFIGEETSDYQNDSTLDLVPALFPPPANTDAEYMAAGLFPEYDLSHYTPEETTDYQASITELELPQLYPQPPTDAEAQAEAQLIETPYEFFYPVETEDYANDSTLDVSNQTSVPPTDEEAQAEAQLSGIDIEVFWPADTDDPSWHTHTPLETPTEIYPADPDVVTQAAGQLPEYPVEEYVAEETQDYAADSTLDITPFLFPTAQEPIETFGAQPHYGELPIEEQLTEDYQAESTLEIPADAGIVNPPPTDAEIAAETQLAEHDFAALTAEETTDYANDSTLDVSYLQAQEPVETFAAQPHWGEYEWWIDDWSDDGDDQSMDITAAALLGEPIETFAAQPAFGEYEWWVDDWSDDGDDQALDITAFLFQPAPLEIHAAQLLLSPEYFWEEFPFFADQDWIPGGLEWLVYPVTPGNINIPALKDPGVAGNALKDPGAQEGAVSGQQVAGNALKDPGIQRNALRDPGISKP